MRDVGVVAEEAVFHEGLRQGRLTRLTNDELFALAYVGIGT